MLIDTHCHLDASEFAADRSQMLAASREAGVSAFVVPAIGVDHFSGVYQLVEAHPDVYFALGIHPLLVDQSADSDLAVLRERVEAARAHPRFVGIGEIGLDFFIPGLDLERQAHFFIEQMRLAKDFELPVIMHVRRSVDAVAKQVRRFRPVSGIAHAFNGSSQQAQQLIDLDLALGFGGAMTFTRALNIRRLARSLPLDAIVLETDSPDISPAWRHPERNSPAELPGIAQVLAELRDIDRDDAVQATARNARRVLPALGNWQERAHLTGRQAPDSRGG